MVLHFVFPLGTSLSLKNIPCKKTELALKEEILCPANVHLCGKRTYDALMEISSFHATEKFGEAKVEYPGVIAGNGYVSPKKKGKDNNLAAHKWFSWNFKMGSRKSKVDLPEIGEEKGDLEKVITVPEGDRQGKPGKFSGNPAGRTGSAEEKLYTAFVLSGGRPAKNPNFLEYDIRIEGDPAFAGKDCIMTAHKSIRIEAGQKIMVTLYKYKTFNYKGFK